MNERLKELRKYLELPQSAFGKKIGITGGGISLLEKGKRNLTDQMILAICREFNVNEEWLRTGDGEMFLDLTEDEFTKAAAKLSQDPFVRSLIIEYWKLDENSKDLFRSFIHKLSDGMRGQEESAVTEERPCGKPPLSKNNIERDVEDYRRQLELERQAEERSGFLQRNA